MSTQNHNVKEVPMSREEHRQRHIQLHRSLDELFADYIEQHPGESKFTQMPLIQLIQWSYEQTFKPTERTR